MSTIKSDICIVGAGLIGSTLALWLDKYSDHKVSLIERSTPAKRPQHANERVVALGALATQLLGDLGITSELSAEYCHAYQGMRVWDEHSNGELCFDAAVDLNLITRDNKSDDALALGHIIDSPMCNYLLQSKLANSNVNCYYHTQADSLELSKTKAILKTQHRQFDSHLLIAADGSRSWVRQQAKIFANHQAYDQLGIVTKIETQESHQDCAWQCFLSTGPVAVLPLQNNQSSIVWSCSKEYAAQVLAMSDNEFEIALCNALQQRLGSIKVLGPRLAFPLTSVRAERYFRRNLALLGDAAHSIHPLAGQGANLGFKDVLAMGLILKDTPSEDLGNPRVLSEYQAKRQPDNLQTDALMSALHHAFKSDFPMWMLARGAGMNILNNFDGLRRALAQHAAGV